MVTADRTRRLAAGAAPLAPLPFLAVAVLPKCPLCLMLLFGTLGIPHGGHETAFVVVQGAMMMAVAGGLALRRPGRAALMLAISGVAVSIAGHVWTASPAPLFLGALLLAAGWTLAFRSVGRRSGCGCLASTPADG